MKLSARKALNGAVLYKKKKKRKIRITAARYGLDLETIKLDERGKGSMVE